MSLSPMMQQYQQAKGACPEALLLFRMGDFYELFYDDAKAAAKLVGLTLTSRDKGENAVPMAGFPHHQLESYLGKLIKQGRRVAVCEQMEDPRQAKGIVKREVTRIVTPGTVTDDELLDPRESNYLAAIAHSSSSSRAASVSERSSSSAGTSRVGLAWVDLSTGKFHAAVVPSERLDDELARIHPAECLLPEEDPLPDGRGSAGVPLAALNGAMLTRRPQWAFNQQLAAESLAKHFQTKTLEGYGFLDDDGLAVAAAGAILDYLTETQKSGVAHIDRLVRYQAGASLEIDESTRRSLELTRTLREGRREGSLLAVLDGTVTAMGSRLLAEWLSAPLTDIAAMEARHDAVAELMKDASLCDGLREALRDIYDLQRLISKVTTGRATPRDLAFIGRTLGKLPAIKARLAARNSALLNQLESDLDLCPEIRGKLESALVEDCPLAAREGGIIRGGYHEPLDALRELAAGGKQWIAKYQKEQIETSGIPSLKVGYNRVFGYYLEVTHAQATKIPPHFIRKQTLKNAERYVTPELKEYEEKVVSADERAKDLEYDLFIELREMTAAQAKRLLQTADVLAALDVLCSLADLARRRGYCRPRMIAEPELHVEDGRHPVLDALAAAGTFVPNDVHAGEEAGRILLITGPNMAGKSTYIRQSALIVIMAQMGSFVPAKAATIGVADRVFARVGASDELSRGQSTFMVEMTETARILNTATPRSLVILDEIGRGTSTYDGVSLAWSVVEHIHNQLNCRTLFATHYHELTDLARSLSGVKNLNVAVREWDEQIVFLHKIVEGAADKSYGIHVARLAGVPKPVIERAKDILWQLEGEHLEAAARVSQENEARCDTMLDADGGGDRPSAVRGGRPVGPRQQQLQLTLFGAEHPLLARLRALNLDTLTPLAAMNLLKEWQEEVQVHPD